ncbi:TRAP transporter small permease [Tepidibacillus fermentans]|uniref:C4-dicarboxylate transporter DctQ subunit n=1 Tax=Tepidibacillus fermentans TaxID=1281767 RepID=A0A4R3KBY9_9BACI|nr:TRAP transporter small permease [Tepidibacillus fermentans]TCS80598.1 C4-dicarboxylate transporter DctQ subunit [Tepidibacillus fermentans]
MKSVNFVLNKLEEIFVILALAVAVTVAFIEVILRQFGTSMGFSFELVNYLLIWVGLIGASIGVRENVHLGVDLLIKNFEAKTQKAILILGNLVSVFFSVLIAYLGYLHVQDVLHLGQLSPEMEMPLYIPRSLIPIAFGLMGIRFLQQTYRIWKTSAEQLEQREGVIHE